MLVKRYLIVFLLLIAFYIPIKQMLINTEYLRILLIFGLLYFSFIFLLCKKNTKLFRLNDIDKTVFLYLLTTFIFIFFRYFFNLSNSREIVMDINTYIFTVLFLYFIYLVLIKKTDNKWIIYTIFFFGTIFSLDFLIGSFLANTFNVPVYKLYPWAEKSLIESGINPLEQYQPLNNRLQRVPGLLNAYLPHGQAFVIGIAFIFSYVLKGFKSFRTIFYFFAILLSLSKSILLAILLIVVLHIIRTEVTKKQIFSFFIVIILLTFTFSTLLKDNLQTTARHWQKSHVIDRTFNPFNELTSFFTKSPKYTILGLDSDIATDTGSSLDSEWHLFHQTLYKFGLIWCVIVLILFFLIYRKLSKVQKYSHDLYIRKLCISCKHTIVFAIIASLHYPVILRGLTLPFFLLVIVLASNLSSCHFCKYSYKYADPTDLV